jgi:hypothetical protein
LGGTTRSGFAMGFSWNSDIRIEKNKKFLQNL